jgi:hypothetical protein
LDYFSAKGVPDFWLTAMKTNEVLADEVNDSAFYVPFYLDTLLYR